MPENTSNRDPLIHLLGAMSDGGTSGYITGMEADGQRRLVHSDRLPTQANGGDEAFLALGFAFGDPDPRDDIFRPATLPHGWRKQGSDHSMWSYVVDELDRRRVSIFYKAAWYDREAFMRLQSVRGYVYEALHGDARLILDEHWCTREAVTDALASMRKEHEEREALYVSRLGDPRVSWAAEELAKTRKDLAKLDRFAATVGGAS